MPFPRLPFLDFCSGRGIGRRFIQQQQQQAATTATKQRSLLDLVTVVLCIEYQVVSLYLGALAEHALLDFKRG